jgi:hypothetical protein
MEFTTSRYLTWTINQRETSKRKRKRERIRVLMRMRMTILSSKLFSAPKVRVLSSTLRITRMMRRLGSRIRSSL